MVLVCTQEKNAIIFDITNEAQMFEVSHYTNLQPLWAAENLSKNAKWEEE